MDNFSEQLDRIEKLLNHQSIYLKEILTAEEVAKYTNYKKSHVYKLTSGNKIPHYKPGGKKLYFRRSEIDEWLLKNKIQTEEELQEAARSFL